MQNNFPVLRTNDQLEHALLSAWSTQADAGICVIDDTLHVVMLNPAACRMLGVDGLTTLHQPFINLVSSINFEPSSDRWLTTPGFLGKRYVTRDSKIGNIDLLFKTTSVHLANSTGNGNVGEIFTVFSITDITKLVAAQRQVNSESYRRQWQALNAGVVISDARLPDMPIAYVNPMFEQMSGYTSNEILGRNCRFLQGSKPDQPGLVTLRQAISNKTNGYAKLRNFRKDSSVFVNELFISLVKDSTGTVTHFVGIQHIGASQSTLITP